MAVPAAQNVDYTDNQKLEMPCVLSRNLLAGKDFVFGRLDGTIVCGSITLAEDGKIGGYWHPNEASWRFSKGDLAFLDVNGNPTTVFDQLEVTDGAYILHGRFRGDPDQRWHILTEKRITPDRLNANIGQISDLIKFVRGQVNSKFVSVFLVHNISTWDALHGIYEEMSKSSDFLPIVITIPFNFGKGRFDGEDDTHIAFDEMNIPHIRFNFDDHREGLALLKALQPDIMFRQAPWDPDIPPAYSVKELSFTKLIYTDYGLGILKDRKGAITYDYDQELHQKAWMLLCANEDQKEIYQTHTHHQGKRAVVTGYPKFDQLMQRGREQSIWPIERSQRAFRLVWAPHHSVRPEWLGFGTFNLVYEEILQWAADNPDVEIVLKPHPMLFESRAHGMLSPAQIDEFIAAWEALPNTSLQTGGDYAPLLSASDAMLTDGVSFLAEYQLFGKPLIFLDSGQHVDFNLIGEYIMKGAYGVRTAGEAIDLIARLRSGTSDPLKPQRDETVRYLMPFPGASSEKTLAAIRERLPA
jgi:hypothetical protein